MEKRLRLTGQVLLEHTVALSIGFLIFAGCLGALGASAHKVWCLWGLFKKGHQRMLMAKTKAVEVTGVCGSRTHHYTFVPLEEHAFEH